MKYIALISIIIISLIGFIGCEDPLGADDYSKRLLVGDSIPEVNNTTVTYNYVKVINETDTIYIEIPVDTITVNRNENAKILKNSLFIAENYIQERPFTAHIDIFWQTHFLEIYEDISFEYYDIHSLPEMDFELDIYNLYNDNLALINIKSIEIDLDDVRIGKGLNFFDMYNGLDVEIEAELNGKDISIDNYDNSFSFVIHGIETHPMDDTIPLFIDFSLISENLLHPFGGIKVDDYSAFNINIRGFLICY